MSESYPHPGDCQLQDATFSIRYLVHCPNSLHFYSCCIFKSKDTKKPPSSHLVLVIIFPNS